VLFNLGLKNKKSNFHETRIIKNIVIPECPCLWYGSG